MLDRPAKLLDDFEEAEREAYRTAKANFESGKSQKLHQRQYQRFDDAAGYRPRDADTFMSFDEYARYREQLHYGFNNELVDVFTKLLEQPEQEILPIDANGGVAAALQALAHRPNLRGITDNWCGMKPYWKWVAMLYGPEIVEKFGGLTVVDPGLLPMGMVSLFRSGRVSWRE